MAIACSTSVFSNSSLEDALAGIAGLGFPCFDLLAIDGWIHLHTSELAREPAAARARIDGLLARHGLRFLAANTGVGPQLHDRSPEANERRRAETAALVDFLRHYGVRVAAVQPRQSDPSRPWDAVLADCITTLREQFAVAGAAGVQLAVELHVNSPFEKLEQARQLFREMPEVRIVFDPTHFYCQGVPFAEFAWTIDHAVHVHLRDAAPGKLQAPFGEGAVNFDEVLGTLKDRGYAGHFSIEYFASPEFDVADSVQRLRDTIARHFPE